MNPICAFGVADLRMSLRLAGVPHVVSIAAMHDHGAIDVVLPSGFGGGRENDFRRAPVDSVVTLRDCDALNEPYL